MFLTLVLTLGSPDERLTYVFQAYDNNQVRTLTLTLTLTLIQDSNISVSASTSLSISLSLSLSLAWPLELIQPHPLRA